MASQPQHTVYRALNKPLTIWGIERKLFMLSALAGVVTFNYFGTLLGGLGVFAALFATIRYKTRRDPQMLHILFRSARLVQHYDPAKRSSA